MKKKDKQTQAKGSDPRHVRNALLLLLLCFAVYANGLRGDFVWDDQVQLFRNTNIRTLDNIPRAFTTSLWSFMYSQDPTADNRAFDQYYRPVQTIVYMLVYQLAGLSPFAYHFTNVALHSAATILLYFLCLELGFDSLIALLVSVLFAVHPVHTEAVTWIAGVGDLACGTFYFAALLTFLRYLGSRTPKWLWISSLCFLAALFSKEMAATLPIVIFLILIAGKEPLRDLRSILVLILPYVLVLGIYAVFRITAVGLSVPSTVQVSASLIDWLTLGVLVVGGYLRYVIAPYPLYIYHLSPLHFSDRILPTILYGAIIAGAAILVLIGRRRFPRPLLWLTIFFVTLIPVLYFRGISGGVFFAERYLYIPSVAIVVAAGYLLSGLNYKQALIVTVAVAGLFSFLTLTRNRDWLNEENLYKRTLQFQPEAVNISTSLGEVYLRKGDNALAQKYFDAALQHVDDSRFIQSSYESYRIYHGLGLAAAQQSQPAAAVAYLQKALDIYPQGDAAYATLGGVLITQGSDSARAMSVLEKAIQLNPVNDLARDYMGVALVNQGEVDRGIEYFRKALEINPDLESAKQHLDLALRIQKK